MANETEKTEAGTPERSPGPETTELELSRGEIDERDLTDLETAISTIDFAARRATPERLARLRVLSSRLADLLEQVEKGVRRRSTEKTIAPDEQERVKALVEEGVALGEKGELERAREKLETAVAADGESADALFNLGVAYGRFAHRRGSEAFAEKAAFCYERVLELEPDNVHALNNLATLYALRDERDLAIETLERSLSIDAEQPDVKRELEELRGS